MNKKNVWQIIGLAAIVVLVIGLPVLLQDKPQNSAPQNTTTVASQELITLSIEGLFENKQVAITPEQTLLQVMQVLNNNDSSIRLLTKDYSGLGTLVEGLGSLTNSTNGEYWQYKVNGVMPQIGAGEYKLQVGDKVEWYFAKSDFGS